MKRSTVVRALALLVAALPVLVRAFDYPESDRFRDLQAGEVFADALPGGDFGPEVVVVPAGSFWMGAESRLPGNGSSSPRHRVSIAYPLAVGRTEVTVSQFAQFVEETRHPIEIGCWSHTDRESWTLDSAANWQHPGFEQSPAHPVTCVTWRDAVAYTRWLSERTGARYRLPSEAEFEFFSRAGNAGATLYRDGDVSELCQLANGADETSLMSYGYACGDGFRHTSPAGHYSANAFGLHDTTGNLWEFTGDCWQGSYARSWRSFFRSPPTDGSAWTRWLCRGHVIRGGSYLSSTTNLQLHHREPGPGLARNNRTGLRVVRDLPN
jgi:formylglycine-generating enzyme required for sulfatase activity